jgi:hypothetical protein
MSVYRVGGNKSSQNVFPSVRPTLDLDFANSKTLDPRIDFTRASGGSYVGADGLIKYAGVNEARFDHDPVTGESLGLLVEESRTNLVTWSQDFSQADWGKSGATIVSTSVKSPIQGINYQKIEATGSNLFAGVTSNAITAATQQRSVSFFAQPLGNISRVLVIIQGVDARININLVDGTFTTNAAGAGSTVSVSGQRFSVSTPTLTGATGVRFFLKRKDDTNATTTVTTIFAGEGLYLTGPQVEAGAFPTSYIPTQASTRTRARDTAAILNIKDFFNPLEGTALIKYKSAYTRSTYTNFGRPFSFNSNVYPLAFTLNGGSNTIYVFAFEELLINFLRFTNVPPNENILNKLLLSYGSRYVRPYLNGVNAQSTNSQLNVPSNDTYQTIPDFNKFEFNELRFGSATSSAATFSYRIRSFTYYPKDLGSYYSKTLSSRD